MSDGVTSDIDVNQGLSVVQVSLASPTLQVQSVIQQNQQILQSTSQNSVIQTAGSNVPTIQVVRVAQVDEEQLSDDSEGRKRREILTRRPSYRKILNDLSSPVSVAKIEEESNSSQSQDGDSQDGTGTSLSAAALQYQSATGDYMIPSGAIQISVNADGTPVAQGLQTLTMTNASPASSAASTGGATIVQYAQGPDGQQFYIPVGSTGTMQAYQIATPGTLPQGVVMATNSTATLSRDAASEEASRKRELRLLKNREAAKECRRKKKDYVKCLENRVAVLENQNKTLIEELKALKELYCQTEV
ncbi:cAMP-responsive element modulator-like isoform X1 [Ruditapes philippinarum]|uniref:cAMP-responsive element modulator-like isoform X1 n=1 Tax=Ruditapes philippinarum TaxID=129788 RepID=UPI00295B77DC|nr:cAMP-responsive element modulator-like isoform X1 [Ruditapes philippinarum]XP_060570960.1 cAMP-responsive element modulator-like isoform X1 [Ruditapes philippinarum]